jgi:hypothetical protein
MFDPKQRIEGKVITGTPVVRDAHVDPTVDPATGKKVRTGKRRIIFNNYQDAVAYQTKKKRYPVVRKVRAKSGEAKDDFFELVCDFKTLQDARDWLFDPEAVNKRMTCLIWYDPKVVL